VLLAVLVLPALDFLVAAPLHVEGAVKALLIAGRGECVIHQYGAQARPMLPV